MRFRKFIREWWPLILILLVGIAARFYRLGTPNEIVFDETYYANFAQDYLKGEKFFDVHPPLGKLLIGAGIHFFGFTPLGWRIGVALFGALIIFLGYLVAQKFFNDRRVAIFTALFIALDGLFIVNSRTALLDNFLLGFVLLAVLLFQHFRVASALSKKTLWLVLTGVALGLALATKWTAFGAFVGIWVWLMAEPKSRVGIKLPLLLLCLLILPLTLYGASFLFDQYSGSYWEYLAWWHRQTINFHLTLKTKHPYMSRWWSWLYLARPVWFYYQEINGKVHGVITLGNPFIWWPALLALLASIGTLLRRRATLLIPILFFAAFYLPWSLIGRTQFSYYLFPALPFLFMLLAYWLVKIEKSAPLFVKTYLIWVVITSIFFYPLWTALPISKDYYQWHVWFRSWI